METGVTPVLPFGGLWCLVVVPTVVTGFTPPLPFGGLWPGETLFAPAMVGVLSPALPLGKWGLDVGCLVAIVQSPLPLVSPHTAFPLTHPPEVELVPFFSWQNLLPNSLVRQLPVDVPVVT
jgi:hypothetical protein